MQPAEEGTTQSFLSVSLPTPIITHAPLPFMLRYMYFGNTSASWLYFLEGLFQGFLYTTPSLQISTTSGSTQLL